MNLAAYMIAAQIVANIVAPQAATVAIAPASVLLEWDAAPNAAAYNVYAGLAHNSYDRVMATANTSIEVTGLSFGFTNHFSVTCVDTNGVESDFAPDLALAPTPALIIFFPQPGTALQSSRDLSTWTARDAVLTNGVWHVRMNPALPMEFYRTLQPTQP